MSVRFFNATAVPPSAVEKFAVCLAPTSGDAESSRCCTASNGVFSTTYGCRLANDQQAAFTKCTGSGIPPGCTPFEEVLEEQMEHITEHLSSLYGQITPGSAACAAFADHPPSADSYAENVVSSSACCERLAGERLKPSLDGSPCVLVNSTETLAEWDKCVLATGAYPVCGDGAAAESYATEHKEDSGAGGVRSGWKRIACALIVSALALM